MSEVPVGLERWGELAALGTACCWTATALFFEAAGHRIGSLVVNLLRLLVALAFLVPACLYLHGQPFPIGFDAGIWFWLGLSGLVGFTIGDLALFRAFVVVGPRASTTIMSLAPVFAALIAWTTIGELLSLQEWAGMAVTITGVVLVVLDRDRSHHRHVGGRAALFGILLALIGAFGQGAGLALSKRGMLEGSGIDPLRANMIRIIAGSVGFAVLFTLIRWWPRVGAGLKDGRAMGLVTAGGICGPFVGVTLSLMAALWTDTGVAATIMALVPVTMIPAVILVRKERVHWRGYVGAVLAVLGVALMVID